MRVLADKTGKKPFGRVIQWIVVFIVSLFLGYINSRISDGGILETIKSAAVIFVVFAVIAGTTVLFNVDPNGYNNPSLPTDFAYFLIQLGYDKAVAHTHTKNLTLSAEGRQAMISYMVSYTDNVISGKMNVQSWLKASQITQFLKP